MLQSINIYNTSLLLQNITQSLYTLMNSDQVIKWFGKLTLGLTH